MSTRPSPDAAKFPAPDRVHFFSPRTRVSLELPVGWVEEEVGDHHVVYALDDAEGAGLPHPPKLFVTVVAMLLEDPDASGQLSQQLLDTPMENLEVQSHEATHIDGNADTADADSNAEATHVNSHIRAADANLHRHTAATDGQSGASGQRR